MSWLPSIYRRRQRDGRAEPKPIKGRWGIDQPETQAALDEAAREADAARDGAR